MHFANIFSALGRRLVANIILISAGFTLLTSSVQLYEIFRSDRSELTKELETVDSSFSEGLEGALWHYDFNQVELLLNGILALRYIVHVNLVTTTGQSWTVGEPMHDDLLIHRIPLNTYHGEKNYQLGQLEIGASLEKIWIRLRGQIVTTALTNFLRTLAVATVILIVFEKMTARHLRHIATRVESDPWLERGDNLQLDRTPTSEPDELDKIVNALNRARHRMSSSFEEIVAQKDRLSILNENLTNANREQAQFTYALSHDLKSPVRLLEILFNELREPDVIQNPELRDEILHDSSNTLARVNNLINNTIKYSDTIDSDRDFEPVDIDALLDKILHQLQHDINDCEAQVVKDRFGIILGNPEQLETLFSSLISNAIKFRRSGVAPVVSIRNELPTTTAVEGCVQEMVALSISDNGVGIEPEHREEVFDLFKKLHVRSEYEGDGLGLAVCKRIVLNHRGKICLADDYANGARFYVTLGSPTAINNNE